MSKMRDGQSYYRQLNRAQAEEGKRRKAEEAQAAIRAKLQLEQEKAKLSGEVSRR